MAVNIASMTTLTSESTVMCAWCMKAQGLDLGDGSHGICKGHAYLLRMRRQMNRTPSLLSYETAALRQYSLRR